MINFLINIYELKFSTIEYYNKAIKLNPKHGIFYNNKGYVYSLFKKKNQKNKGYQFVILWKGNLIESKFFN